VITSEARDLIGERQREVIQVRCATRQAHEFGKRIEVSEENWDQLVSEHRNTTIPENVDKLLSVFAHRCPRPRRNWLPAPYEDFLVIDVQDGPEFTWYLDYLEKRGYLQKLGKGTEASHYELTRISHTEIES